MSALTLTGNESADQLIKQMVWLRFVARNTVHARGILRKAIDSHKNLEPSEKLIRAREVDLELRFAEIEIGRYAFVLADALDGKASRDAIFDALNVNAADRRSAEVREHGEKTSHLIWVLNLENSATTSDDIEIRPLNWCCTMAFMHEKKTNAKLDRATHEQVNALFGGAFGEFRERSPLERMGVPR